MSSSGACCPHACHCLCAGWCMYGALLEGVCILSFAWEVGCCVACWARVFALRLISAPQIMCVGARCIADFRLVPAGAICQPVLLGSSCCAVCVLGCRGLAASQHMLVSFGRVPGQPCGFAACGGVRGVAQVAVQRSIAGCACLVLSRDGRLQCSECMLCLARAPGHEFGHAWHIALGCTHSTCHAQCGLCRDKACVAISSRVVVSCQQAAGVHTALQLSCVAAFACKPDSCNQCRYIPMGNVPGLQTGCAGLQTARTVGMPAQARQVYTVTGSHAPQTTGLCPLGFTSRHTASRPQPYAHRTPTMYVQIQWHIHDQTSTNQHIVKLLQHGHG
jgi:hypothetical protein